MTRDAFPVSGQTIDAGRRLGSSLIEVVDTSAEQRMMRPKPERQDVERTSEPVPVARHDDHLAVPVNRVEHGLDHRRHAAR